MDDLNDILNDARRLVEWLLKQGEHADARKLEAYIKKASKLAVSLALLVGAYYFAIKFRAGRLLFQWGWLAVGSHFQRATGRLERLLPSLEDSLADIVEIAKKHPRSAGSGIRWKVLHELVDESIPAQIDDAACGPACLEIVLRDRGIQVSHATIVDRARKMAPLANRFVALDVVVDLLNEFDSNAWQGGDAIPRPGQTVKELVQRLNETGTWIALINDHFVVIDGFNAQGDIMIRDPWFEPGLQRGIRAGSRYRVRWQTFSGLWRGTGIFRTGGKR